LSWANTGLAQTLGVNYFLPLSFCIWDDNGREGQRRRRGEEGSTWHGRRGRLVLLLTGGGVVGGDASVNCWMREKKGKLAVEELLLLLPL